MLGIKWCPEAGGATVGGLEGSALAGIWTAGVPSNKRDNVGASNTHTHRFSAKDTQTQSSRFTSIIQIIGTLKINPAVDTTQGYFRLF